METIRPSSLPDQTGSALPCSSTLCRGLPPQKRRCQGLNISHLSDMLCMSRQYVCCSILLASLAFLFVCECYLIATRPPPVMRGPFVSKQREHNEWMGVDGTTARLSLHQGTFTLCQQIIPLCVTSWSPAHHIWALINLPVKFFWR